MGRSTTKLSQRERTSKCLNLFELKLDLHIFRGLRSRNRNLVKEQILSLKIITHISVLRSSCRRARPPSIPSRGGRDRLRQQGQPVHFQSDQPGNSSERKLINFKRNFLFFLGDRLSNGRYYVLCRAVRPASQHCQSGDSPDCW